MSVLWRGQNVNILVLGVVIAFFAFLANTDGTLVAYLQYLILVTRGSMQAGEALTDYLGYAYPWRHLFSRELRHLDQ